MEQTRRKHIRNDATVCAAWKFQFGFHTRVDVGSVFFGFGAEHFRLFAHEMTDKAYRVTTCVHERAASEVITKTDVGWNRKQKTKTGFDIFYFAKLAAGNDLFHAHRQRMITIGKGFAQDSSACFGGFCHLHGFFRIRSKWFFAQHMFALRDGVERDGRVREIRRRDDDGVNVIAPDDLLGAGRGDGDAGLLPRAFERGGVGVAQRRDLHLRAKRQAGQMILQRDATAADDGKIKGVA